MLSVEKSEYRIHIYSFDIHINENHNPKKRNLWNSNVILLKVRS